ncbi:hypothetical protein [Bacillus cereus]|uniref:hypothetical protein n=1 Tax=Bacillus cereus TaxID=1396 RepID=UPI0011557611|nr:hypothetical protein [Bacillus cereus]HDR7998359.1 hypothetical protein [Bacillus cereus]
MRHTRNIQMYKLTNDKWWKESSPSMTMQNSIKLDWRIDKSFMWLRIQYEGDKKVRNYWGIAGTYARKIK